MRKLLAIAIVMSCVQICMGQTEGRIHVKGTSVSLVLPNGFSKLSTAEAYVHESTGSNMIVKESTKAAYMLCAEGFTEEYFNNQNLTFIKHESNTFDKVKGESYLSSFYIDDMLFYRLFFVTGNTNRTILVILNIPQIVYDAMYPEVSNSLNSITHD